MYTSFPLALASAHKCHTFASDKLVVYFAKYLQLLAAVNLKFVSWLKALASQNMPYIVVT